MAMTAGEYIQQREFERLRKQRQEDELRMALKKPQAVDKSGPVAPGVVESGQTSRLNLAADRGDTAGVQAEMESPSGASKAQGAAGLAQLLGSAQGSESGDVLSSSGQGAAVGTAIAPGMGTAIGAGAGALAGIMSSRAKRKQREREANQRAWQNISQIEQQTGNQQAAILSRLMGSLGSRR